MAQITSTQLETLQSIERNFSTTLVKDHFNDDSGAANAAFSEALSLSEKFRIFVAAFKYKKLPSDDINVTAKRLLNYCDRAVPALTTVFGEQALVDALPEEARTQEIVDLSRDLGGEQVARLLEKSL